MNEMPILKSSLTLRKDCNFGRRYTIFILPSKFLCLQDNLPFAKIFFQT